MSTRRLAACVENWPECASGQYNPACCRFPKSCSCTSYRDGIDESRLEPASNQEATMPDQASDDRQFLDALNRQFETFFRLDELRKILEPDAYIQVRAAFAIRPIHTWRGFADAAVALAKGGMAPADIATYGLDAVDRIVAKGVYGRHVQVAEMVAAIAATYSLTGERIRTIETVIEKVAIAVQGGF